MSCTYSFSEFSIGGFLRLTQICIERLSSIRQSLAFHVGIFSLPKELLSLVFEIACEPPSSAYNTLKHFQAHASALSVSHVSRHFRAVAIGTPQIWSNISSMQWPQYIVACLERSKGRNLNIFFDTTQVFTGPDSYVETLSLSGIHASRPPAR